MKSQVQLNIQVHSGIPSRTELDIFELVVLHGVKLFENVLHMLIDTDPSYTGTAMKHTLVNHTEC